MPEKLNKGIISNIIALSHLQKGILFHHLENPHSEAYFEKVAIELRGLLIDSCFLDAWKTTIQTHDTLRTVFRWERVQNPVQIVLREKEVLIEIYDTTTFDDSQQEIHLLSQAKINLVDHPFRIILFKRGGTHTLWLIYSHILLDGWSISLLMREFLSRYALLYATGTVSRATKPQFNSYIKYLQTVDKSTHAPYWRALFSDLERSTYIYSDQICQVQNKGYQWLSESITSELFTALSTCAKENHVSLATMFYASWALLLHLYSCSSHVIFGATMSQRNVPIKGGDEIVGLMINTIPFKVSLSPELTVRKLLQSMQHQILESQEHAVLSLPEIKNCLGIKQGEELFDSLVVVENYPSYRSWQEGESPLLVTAFSNKEFTHYPLTIIFDLLDGAHLKISYDTKQYSEGYIQQLLHHLIAILETLPINDAQEMRSLPLFSLEEAQKQAALFNATHSHHPNRQINVVDLFKEQVSLCPGQIAVVDDRHMVTYRELDDYSEKLAAQIRACSISHEEKMGVMATKGIPMILSLLAILKVGGAYVPMHPKLPQMRKDFIIADCQMRIILSSHSNENILPDIGIIDTFRTPQKHTQTRGLDSSALLCYILYSSGSTGTPKGIAINHRGIIRLVKQTNFIAFLPTDRFLSTCPLDFDVAGLEIWGTLLNGSTLYLTEESSLLALDVVEELLRKNKINKLWLSTPLFNAWVNGNPQLFKYLDYVIIGGDVLSPAHIQKVKRAYPHLKMVNGYGPTENSVISTAFEISSCEYSRIPIGKPIANSTAYVVNNYGRIQPIGAVGELWLGGDGVARGYHNNPSLTREKFIKNPFGSGVLFKSGDLARWLVDGSIDFLGRRDFQCKVRGFRVELFEVESAIKAHPLISEAVVKVEEVPPQDKILVAYIQKTGELPLEELKSHLQSILPHYFLPSVFVTVPCFPLTPTGKIDRQQLKRELVDEKKEERGSTHAYPASSLEKTLLNIYTRVIQKPALSSHENFFDSGGNSLHTIQIRGLIEKELGVKIPIADLFQFPTVFLLAQHLAGKSENGIIPSGEKKHLNHQEEIAVIGLSCRLPGAKNIEEFWENLQSERDCVQRFEEKELLEGGIEQSLVQQKNYVPVKGVLDDIEYFDHLFFGYSEREAEMMDPQMRLLHHCCWEALEDGGHIPKNFKGKIGLFIGSEWNIYWVDSLLEHIGEPAEMWEAAHYVAHSITTPVSYKLKLTGPSITINTACSSSLVAVHQAKLSLLAGECDIALAGGVSIELPKKKGYVYQEGMIFSKDGKCRAFDAKADGTVSGDGIGIVLLKPFKQALLDQDTIYAVLKGSAVNNDGDRKVGYTAPSIAGQHEVIEAALKAASIDPDAVSYIEAHGTGTSLGDPIEIRALKQAYLRSSIRSPLYIGSVKTNIGHLNTAAGIAGFIKTVLALHHQFLPASLHFEKENPECAFADTPMRVISKGMRWPGIGKRVAAVSSFGVGGTNAHAILEEFFPEQEVSSSTPNPATSSHLLLLSARSKRALMNQVLSLKSALSKKGLTLKDAAYTLQTKRGHFEFRTSVLGSTLGEIEEKLASLHLEISEISLPHSPNIAFIFSDQIDQNLILNQPLHQRFPAMKEIIDRGIAVIENHSSHLSEVMRNNPTSQSAAVAPFSEALTFINNYALATFLQELGLLPLATLGHGTGEYVCACLAGVFTFEEGVHLLVRRTDVLRQLPRETMLAIRSDREVVRNLLTRCPEVRLVAENSQEDFVLSGNDPSVRALYKIAQGEGIPAFVLKNSYPSFSADRLLTEEFFREVFDGVVLKKPRARYMSTILGSWIDPHEVATPEYWIRQALETQQFSRGISLLIEENVELFIEIGPEKQLSSLISRQLSQGNPSNALALSIAPHPTETLSHEHLFFRVLEQAWLRGHDIRWDKLYTGREKKGDLPSYPFDAYYFWKFGNRKQRKVYEQSLSPAAPSLHMFSVGWKQTSLSLSRSPIQVYGVIHRGTALDRTLLRAIEKQGTVYEIDLSQKGATDRVAQWCQSLPPSCHLIYTCFLRPFTKQSHPDVTHFCQCVDLYLYPLLEVVQSLGVDHNSRTIKLSVISQNSLTPNTPVGSSDPTTSILVPFLRSIHTEYSWIKPLYVDIDSKTEELHSLLEILSSDIQEKGDPLREIALRQGKELFIPTLSEEPFSTYSQPVPFRKNGVYLITGGTGGIGLVLAEFLAEKYAANLILVSRSGDRFEQECALVQKEKVASIRAKAASVIIKSVDIADQTAVEQLFSMIIQQFSSIQGIVHLAGVVDQGLIQTKRREHFHSLFRPKVLGAINLINTINTLPARPDFIIFASSLASIRGDFGQAGYVMANYFLNSFAHQCREQYCLPILSLAWDTWGEVGMARRYYAQTRDARVGTQVQPLAQITFVLSADDHWFLNEHRLNGDPILPGTGFVAVLIRELFSHGYSFPIHLNSIHFLNPFIISKETPAAPVVLTICLVEGDAEEFSFAFKTKPAVQKEEVTLCEGVFCTFLPQTTIPVSPRAIKGIESYENTASFPQGGTLKAKDRHLQFGARWDNLKKVRYSSHPEGVAFLSLPQPFLSDLTDFSVHPALLDNATSFLLDLFYPSVALLPFGYRHFTFYRRLPSEIYSVASLIHENLEEGILVFRIEIFDSDHECCAGGEITFKRVGSQLEKSQDNQNYSLRLHKVGDFENLTYEPCEKRPLQGEEVEFETMATGLNFKEVLYSLGLIPPLTIGENQGFGLEAAGIVTRVGENVKKIKTGDAVFGMVSGGFDRFVVTNQDNLVPKPTHLSFEVAASIPVAFLTAYTGLVEKAHLKRGERVLIHSAAGGVGLAAVEIASRLGAEIYASAGTEEKRAFLRSKGVQEVFKSDEDCFVKKILTDTQMQGVDVILNFSTGDMLKRSLEVLARYGRFVEIGIKDILEDSPLGMGVFHKGISFHALSISPQMPQYASYLQVIADHFSKQIWEPPPITVFTKPHTRDAFRMLAGGKHIGKIVVIHHESSSLKEWNARHTTDGLSHISNKEGIDSFIKAAEIICCMAPLSEVYVTKRPDVHTTSPPLTYKCPSVTHKKPRPTLSTDYVPPSHPVELLLIEIFQDYLGIEEVGTEDHFADLGLTSLDIVQVQSRISKKVSMDVPIVQFYASSTVATLSIWIEKNRNKETMTLCENTTQDCK